METRFFIDNGNRTAWRKTWFWQLGNWWIYYILSNYNTFSTLPYSLRATSCKWMRHLEKVAANSFRQSRLWLPRKLPHRKARCIFTHSAVFSIFSCIKWHIFKIILIVVKCWYDYWKKTYGKIIKNIVLYKAGLTTISTLSSQGDLGSTKYFGCKGPFNSPHLCTAFKWKVDLQEKLVGGTFIKEQMHNFKIVYAEARSPRCTQGSHNNGKYSVNLDPHPGTTHYSNTYFGFLDKVCLRCFFENALSFDKLWLWSYFGNPDSKRKTFGKSHFERKIPRHGFQMKYHRILQNLLLKTILKDIFNFICWSNQVHRLPNNLNMHQCQHSDQLRPFILLLDHVPDLLSELPGDLVL